MNLQPASLAVYATVGLTVITGIAAALGVHPDAVPDATTNAAILLGGQAVIAAAHWYATRHPAPVVPAPIIPKG